MATQGVVQPAKGRRDFMRMFRELKQAVTNDWGGVKPLVMEEDKEFLEKKGKLQDLEQQLTTASKQVCVDCLYLGRKIFSSFSSLDYMETATFSNLAS